MMVGNQVKLIGIPPGIHESGDMQTRTLFEKCLHRIFLITKIENVEELPHPLIRLEVGEVMGRKSFEEVIWVEPEYLELMPSK